jgi:hypothetical protein
MLYRITYTRKASSFYIEIKNIMLFLKGKSFFVSVEYELSDIMNLCSQLVKQQGVVEVCQELTLMRV